MLTLNIFALFCDCWWLPWLLPLLLSLFSLWMLRRHWQEKYSDLEGVAHGLRMTIDGLQSDLIACGKSKSKLKADLALSEGRYRELERAMDLQNENDAKANVGIGFVGGASDDDESDKDDDDIGNNSNTGIGSLYSASTGAAGVSSFIGNDSGHNSGGEPSKIDVDKYAKITDNNLQIIEGIGPKMESVLNENGISSLTVLASKSHAELRAILDKYDDKYRIIDPSGWSAQAKLARDRDFDGLIAYQKTDGSESKIEKLFVKLGIVKSYALDDLKAIEGIGPKIEVLLNDAGINTWRKLAGTSVEHLNSIISKAGPRFQLADPTTWPQQAEYAADGEWDALEEYQDFLDGGRDPS
jgi:predicted flap endonuclease-1-like 5' DNA nuclease